MPKCGYSKKAKKTDKQISKGVFGFNGFIFFFGETNKLIVEYDECQQIDRLQSDGWFKRKENRSNGKITIYRFFIILKCLYICCFNLIAKITSNENIVQKPEK